MNRVPRYNPRKAVILLNAWLAVCSQFAHATNPVDSRSLNGKLVMGYQGWFQCPSDRKDGRWFHWYNGDDVTVDLLPDVTEYVAAGRCPTAMHLASGKDVEFFSSQSLPVVETHFAWMEAYGLDGVALQRFLGSTPDPKYMAVIDTVLDHVRRAAEDHGRVFYVMYDVGGIPAAKLDEVVEDWQRLEATGLTRSAAYLHHRGHPLLGLWGLGFGFGDLKPADVLRLIDSLKIASAAYGGLTIMGGVPTGWRTGTGDAAQDLDWQEIWPKLGVLSPWTVGRYSDDAGADVYRIRNLIPDIAEATRIKVDYMPVVFPGSSWANLMTARHQISKAKRNEIPRRCGRFYWRQVFNATQAGATMLYGAMFDEVDEGTAMFKMVPSATQLPADQWFLTLDADGCRLPSDWYLRLAGKATEALHKRGTITSDLPLKLPVAQ